MSSHPSRTDLRHTFASSHLVMRGVALKAVQEFLGHATIEMRMRHAHLSPDVKRDAVKLLDAPLAHGVTRRADREQGPGERALDGAAKGI